MNKLGKILPIMEWLPSYRKEWLRFDLVAGLTTAAVIIPKAMAYAAIAGLPLVVGLYTSLVMLVVYAAFGNRSAADRWRLAEGLVEAALVDTVQQSGALLAGLDGSILLARRATVPFNPSSTNRRKWSNSSGMSPAAP